MNNDKYVAMDVHKASVIMWSKQTQSPRISSLLHWLIAAESTIGHGLTQIEAGCRGWAMTKLPWRRHSQS
ncbi:MAG TPA: hypothetical protein VMM84_12660 [Pyrinomonadaceae bacterium]|nr:hypothetical protein [Pyrinomonadaceae bacterium]